MVMDAKLETMGLIRNKLKQENQSFKQENQSFKQELEAKRLELEALGHELRLASNAAERDAGAALAEKDTLRHEFGQIQSMYNTELEALQKRLEAAEAFSAVATPGRCRELEARVNDLEADVSRLVDESGRLSTLLSDDRDMRATLAADLVAQRGEKERLIEELTTLKLHQKFINEGPPRHGAGGIPSIPSIPSERIDMMRMVNQMLSQNNQLKEDKILLEAKLSKLQRSCLHSAIDTASIKGGPGEREIALAASEKINDLDITARILARNLDTVAKVSLPGGLLAPSFSALVVPEALKSADNKDAGAVAPPPLFEPRSATGEWKWGGQPLSLA